jgi:hypothetical protein
LSGIGNDDLGFREGEDSSCLRRRGHSTRQFKFKACTLFSWIQGVRNVMLGSLVSSILNHNGSSHYLSVLISTRSGNALDFQCLLLLPIALLYLYQDFTEKVIFQDSLQYVNIQNKLHL